MPDLENLKKQAKQLVRWHRERNYAVAARIRQALPRFRDSSDAQILGATFSLAEAQAIIAREAGFDGWAALKTGAATMTKQDQTAAVSEPKILESEPELYVASISRSLAFFVDKLGFTKVFDYGEPPFYAQVRRGSARMNLRLVCEPVYVGDIREREQLLAASFTVENIKVLFAEFEAAGADFHMRLKRQPWGAQNFIIRDLDGNLLLFAE
jgi:uncharacterized glyoxalase superfamily protein PhnB